MSAVAAKPVLVATDFSETAMRALVEATARFPGSPLLLVHVVDPEYGARVGAATGLDAADVQQRAWNRADVQLDETVGRLRSEGHSARGLLLEGPLAATLAEAATSHAAALIVLGLDPATCADRLPFSLARSTALPVLIIPESA